MNPKQSIRPCARAAPGSYRRAFSVYFDAEQLVAIEKAAVEQRISNSEFLRRMVDEWMEKNST